MCNSCVLRSWMRASISVFCFLWTKGKVRELAMEPWYLGQLSHKIWLLLLCLLLKMEMNGRYLLAGIIGITYIIFAVVRSLSNSLHSAQMHRVVPPFKQKWYSEMLPSRMTNHSENKVAWESGLRYKHTCRVSNRGKARCCENNPNYEQLHLTPGGLSFNETVKTFMRKIHSKIVVFVGDSLLFQLFWGFLDALDLQFVDTYPRRCRTCGCALKHPCEGRKGDTALKFKIIVVWKIAHLSCVKVKPERCVYFNEIGSILNTSDIVIFQIGIHYSFVPKVEYAMLLNELGKIAQAEMRNHPGKEVILRSTLPQHFLTHDGWFHKNKEKSKKCNKISYKEHWTNSYLKSTVAQFGFKYMDSAPFYVDKWDLHANPRDCTHSCLTAEVTIPEMALLNSLLV